MALCHQCNSELKPGMKFCDNCGTPVSRPENTAVPSGGQIQPPPESPPQGQPPQGQPQGGRPPQGQPPQGQPPQGQPPQGQPPQGGRPPQGQPGGYPPQGQPQQSQPQGGRPPQGQPGGYPPQGQPPQGQPQGGYPPQGQPPQGQPQGGYPPQGQPQQSQPQGGRPPQGQPGGYPPQGQPGGYPPQGQSPAPKKKSGGKVILFVVLGIVVLGIAAAAFFLLGGKGDSNGGEAHLGVWVPAAVNLDGMELDAEGLLDEDELSIELKKGGKAIISADGERFDCKWTLKDEALTIKTDEGTVQGILKGDKMIFEDWMETGMGITMKKKGASKGSSGSSQSSVPKKDDPIGPIGGEKPEEMGVQELWNGTWYGYFWVTDTFGLFAVDQDLYDAFMVLEVDENGDGTMGIMIEDADYPMIYANITADDYHFEVVSGYHWGDMELDPFIWWIGFSPMDDGHLVIISDKYVDPEGDTEVGETGYEFMCAFRPFGERWDVNNDKLPPGYDSYANAIEAGVDDAYEWYNERFYEFGGQPPSKEEHYGEPLLQFSGAELRQIYENLPTSADMTYEEVRDTFFGEVEGALDFEEGNTIMMLWRASDNEDHYLRLTFKDSNNTGRKTLTGKSGSMPQ